MTGAEKQVTNVETVINFFRKHAGEKFTIQQLMDDHGFTTKTPAVCRELVKSELLQLARESDGRKWSNVYWLPAGFGVTVDRTSDGLLLSKVLLADREVELQAEQVTGSDGESSQLVHRKTQRT
ncbi:MAG: hypothetical protein ACFFD4_21230 [Candidatus Odinarchaeota archaeon]